MRYRAHISGRSRLLFSLALLLSLAGWQEARATISVGDGIQGAGNSPTTTFSITPAGNNRMLLIGISVRSTSGTATVTSVTDNGTPMSLIPNTAINNPTDPTLFVAQYYLLSPPTTQNDIVITTPNSSVLAYGAVVLLGVDQSSTFIQSASDANTGTTARVSYSGFPQGSAWVTTIATGDTVGLTGFPNDQGLWDVSLLSQNLQGAGNLQTVDATGSGQSGWTLSPSAPWALSYTNLRAAAPPTAADSIISGHVLTPGGAPLAGAVVTLSGTQSRRAVTDAQGRYRFDNVETSGFYTVTPSRANYTFTPASRSFSIVGNQTDAAFSAEATAETANPLDTEPFFVRQHYLDFLDREPEQGGLDYWSTQLDGCKGDAGCLRSARTNVSAAFFIAEEMQRTGSFVYRLYKGALGRQVSYAEFATDRQQVRGGDNLDSARDALTDGFVERAEFTRKYVAAATAESFVDALLQTMRQSSGADLSARKADLIALYKTGKSMRESRSLVVREAIDEPSFRQAEYNRSFVLMQYFGYLKREPEAAGYDFWLNVLNDKDPGNYRGMVCSFLTSAEYQLRFSSVVTHNNAECQQ
jgi:hypothetical protein